MCQVNSGNPANGSPSFRFASADADTTIERSADLKSHNNKRQSIWKEILEGSVLNDMPHDVNAGAR
jgi:hypothetical protein